MNISDSLLITAPVDTVWHRLMTDSALQSAIPGCDSLRPAPDGGLIAQVRLSLIWMKRDLKLALRREIRDPGKALDLVGTRGTAQSGRLSIFLAPEGAHCRLSYSLTAELGSGAAALGGAMLGRTARRLIAETLRRLV